MSTKADASTTARTSASTALRATGERRFTPGIDVRVAVARIGWELRSYVRQPAVMVFTFVFPLGLFVLFSIAFSSLDSPFPGVSMADVYLPSLLAAGVVLSGIQNLSVDIASEKGDGTLTRLAATPLRPWQYFVGKLGQVLVTGLVQAVLLTAVAAIGFGVALPSDASSWLTIAWVFVLGLSASAMLGIAVSGLVRDGKAASAIVIPVLVALQFVSGIYLPYWMLPDWLLTVAGVLPLRWAAQGFRAGFLPEEMAALEPGGDFALPMVALMLAVWLVVGIVLSRMTFRWIRGR